MSQQNDMKVIIIGTAEEALASKDAVTMENIGRSTCRFVKRLMRDPILRDRIKARAAEIRASGEYSKENSHV